MKFAGRKLIMIVMVGIFFLSNSWTGASSVVRAAEDLRPVFYQANQYYESGDFAKAIASYEEILTKGQASGSVYYNLGNAYYRAGQKGQALVNYLRARLWIPRDPDVRANLEHVQADLELTDENSGWITAFAAGIGNMVSLSEMAWFASLLFTIVTVLFLIRLFRSELRSHMQIPLVVVAVFLGVALLGVGLSAMDHSRNIAVVVVKEATARFEPSESGGAHFTLKEGNRATIDTVREGWILLRRSDGKKGWVKTEEAEPLLVTAAK